ncbi:hypothetical protein B0J11DRAFT_531672 [Dendryphion nanum]|uniref:DUF2423 domain-containing protein n=1 Tax=Dendryphion nanum TaxID=256645 RepID=A0A9P9DP51_9PLEO|nr:hypothetical protein B0J11DRAFT_531672 [Dendryphion nanum]
MAKGLRASSKKSNRSKLRARVFGPVEDARTERLHAKLLEVVQQQKPEQPAKKEMDIDSADEDSKDAGKEDDFPKGSYFHTAKIPRSFSDDEDPRHIPQQESSDTENLFMYMGLCSDIVGFNDDGDLEFAFDPLPLLNGC